MVALLALLCLLDSSRPALSTLTAQVPQAGFEAPADPTTGFTLRFTVDLRDFDGEHEILAVPDVLGVRLRRHDPLDRTRQNYPAFSMPDGSVPVLEATITLHSDEHLDWRNMTIGIPLAMLGNTWGEHEVVLDFSGARWTLSADGNLLDNDFPFGFPQWRKENTWRLDPEFVKRAELRFPAPTPGVGRPTPSTIASAQYWTPPGHNCWVGDVVTIFHLGRYHVFYLYDRRHHASKFGCGAHYFEHLSTTDFRSWTVHEAATPLEEQWECIGTGTPFVLNGRLHLAYGLHTERIFPDAKTMWPAQRAYLEKHGRTGAFNRATTPGGAPAGSTYAVSRDGVAGFSKSWNFFHPCRNPSVYVDPDGILRMLANHGGKGMWESEQLDGGWRCTNPEFPPGGDCTFHFRWGRFDYIIGGFKDLWSKPAGAPDTAYQDVVAMGLDFYDGLAVPAISEIAGGRFLMAGWLGVRGWGGVLAIRELIQSPDGRIGSKWMNELTPATADPGTPATTITGTNDLPVDARAFMLSFDVVPAQPGKGSLSVSFLPQDGGRGALTLEMNLDERRASFGRQLGNLAGVDRPFSVRVIVMGDDKLGGSLLDAEIAAARTAISFREDLAVKKLQFRAEGVEFRNVRIAPLRNPE